MKSAEIMLCCGFCSVITRLQGHYSERLPHIHCDILCSNLCSALAYSPMLVMCSLQFRLWCLFLYSACCIIISLSFFLSLYLRNWHSHSCGSHHISVVFGRVIQATWLAYVPDGWVSEWGELVLTQTIAASLPAPWHQRSSDIAVTLQHARSY